MSLCIKNLEDLLAERESIAQAMQKLLHEAAGPWGVHVERVEGRDVRVPEPLMRAMAAEAEAAREASAKVIAAEGEYKASRALNHAADVIADCPAALEVGLTYRQSHYFTCSISVALPTDPEQHLYGK